jgi:hypothetical protein
MVGKKTRETTLDGVVKDVKDVMYGMTEISKIHKVTIGCTIPLATPYANIKVEVEGDDAESSRRALVELLSITLQPTSEPDRESINRYVRNILIRKV